MKLELPGDLTWRAILVIAGALVCQMGLGFGYVFGPLAPFILEDLGWSRSAYSAARAPQLFVLALASPLVGAAVIRLGARPILIVATAIIGVAFLLFSRMEHLWQLYAVVVLMGVALTGIGDVTVGQLVTQWVGRGRGLALGIVYTGSNLGGFVLVPFAVGMAQDTSWREALSTMGIGALLVMVPIAIGLVRAPGANTAQRAGAIATRVLEPLGAGDDMNLAAALRTRSFWILAFTLFTFFFYFLGMLEHLVLFLTDHGMPRAEAGGYFARAIGLGIASKIILGAVADRIPYRAAILFDYGLLAFSSVVLLFLPNSALIWLFVFTYGFATAARDVVYPLIVTDCFGTRYMAEIYGALMLALMPGGALGPLFAAAVHDRTGSYDAAFGTFAVLNLAALAALFGLRREFRHAGAPR